MFTQALIMYCPGINALWDLPPKKENSSRGSGQEEGGSYGELLLGCVLGTNSITLQSLIWLNILNWFICFIKHIHFRKANLYFLKSRCHSVESLDHSRSTMGRQWDGEATFSSSSSQLCPSKRRANRLTTVDLRFPWAQWKCRQQLFLVAQRRLDG